MKEKLLFQHNHEKGSVVAILCDMGSQIAIKGISGRLSRAIMPKSQFNDEYTKLRTS